MNAAESREKARSAAAEEGCTNRTCFTAADLIYFCTKYTTFTKFYEFMLQKVLKFADYAMVMLIWKICFFAPIMPKIMLAQSAKANLQVTLPFLKMNPQNN